MTTTIKDNVLYLESNIGMYITQNYDVLIQNRYFAHSVATNSKCSPTLFRDATQAEKDKHEIDLAKWAEDFNNGTLSEPTEIHEV